MKKQLHIATNPRNRSTKYNAWIDKAQATFWLTTSANNRYDEAMRYLIRAKELSPSDNRITQVSEAITETQLTWLNSLGVDAYNKAEEIYNIWIGWNN